MSSTFQAAKGKRPPLWPLALNADGHLVAAADALRDPYAEYRCVDCGASVFPRGGGLWGARFVVAHFAHKGNMGRCSGESQEHRQCIWVIYNGILNSRREGKPYLAEWECDECHSNNTLDLAMPDASPHMSAPIENIIPDLLITHENGDLVAGIEVVWKHPVDERKLEIYRRLNLPLIIVRAEEDALDELKTGIPSRLAEVHLLPCSAHSAKPASPVIPVCGDCGGPVLRFRFEVWSGYTCYHCGAPVPVLKAFHPDADGDWRETPELVRGMETPAAILGVIIRDAYSAGQRRSYMMHHCPRCDFRQGDYYVRNQAKNRRWKPEPDHPIRVAEFFYCPECRCWKKQSSQELQMTLQSPDPVSEEVHNSGVPQSAATSTR